MGGDEAAAAGRRDQRGSVTAVLPRRRPPAAGGAGHPRRPPPPGDTRAASSGPARGRGERRELPPPSASRRHRRGWGLLLRPAGRRQMLRGSCWGGEGGARPRGLTQPPGVGSQRGRHLHPPGGASNQPSPRSPNWGTVAPSQRGAQAARPSLHLLSDEQQAPGTCSGYRALPAAGRAVAPLPPELPVTDARARSFPSLPPAEPGQGCEAAALGRKVKQESHRHRSQILF